MYTLEGIFVHMYIFTCIYNVSLDYIPILHAYKIEYEARTESSLGPAGGPYIYTYIHA